MLYLLSYDLEDDRRRTRLHKLLGKYGPRVQKSVFECDLGEGDLQALLERAEKLVVGDFDSLRVYALCGECREKVRLLGCGRPPEEPEDVFIV